MAEERPGRNNRTDPYDVAPRGCVDLFMRSESPRVQFDLLKQKLHEEIKNSPATIKYIDSELHLRRNQKFNKYYNSDRCPFDASSAPEIQSATVDFGGSTSSPNGRHSGRTSMGGDTFAAESTSQCKEHLKHTFEPIGSGKSDRLGELTAPRNKDCQVCLIRGFKDDLVNITKLVQERNEQISKLKTKYLRSYFKSHIND